jgi:deoxyribodipyrimidine photo-lyase
MLTVLWFKRDLRVADHPALALAVAQGGAVLPLYIVEPGLWGQPDAAGRHWAFLADALATLRDDLAALGQPLLIRRGEAVAELARLHAAHPFAHLVSHEETGTAWTYARDRAVAAWARAQGIRWTEVPQSGVVRRLRTRDGWSDRRDRFMTAPLVPPPAALAPILEVAPVPVAAFAPALAPDPCPGRQRGGRPEAEALLASFLAHRARPYRRAMSSPLAAERACSRLSPHLAWGTLSAREVVQATAAAPRPDPDLRASLRSFDARLAWRDHFIQKLEDAPDLDTRALHPGTEALRPRLPDPDRLAAWTRGETGLPFVDACMRYLARTGWLNFRMRAMLVSVASYHLWLDWRATGPILARRFTDYEPGIHWAQMQMQSGATGINTIRIYNPVKQGLDQDPTGRFIRAWLPELAPVPDAFLHEPWRWPDAARLAGRYPAPIVDPAAAARAAREAVWGLRRAPGFAQAAAEVVTRHASRKDGAGRFVNDRAARPRRARPVAGQLSFDL